MLTALLVFFTLYYFIYIKSKLIKKKLFLKFYFVLGPCCSMGFSLVVESRGYALVAVCRFLIVVASLAVEQGLYGVQASVVAAPGL